MNSDNKIHTEVLIVGGGILGLWLLRLLHLAGIKAILIEKNALGSKQTIASQGMIHGGQRYNLLGKVSNHAKLISKMRDHWIDCLNGREKIDLTQTQVLANDQNIISKHSMFNQFSMNFAKLWMQNKMKEIDKTVLPQYLKQYDYFFYQLAEPVVGVKSLISNLSQPLEKYIFKANIQEVVFKNNQENQQKIDSVFCDIDGEKLNIKANYFCFTAGEGNFELLKKMNFNPKNLMQTRALRQFIVKGVDCDLYAHLLGFDGIDARPSLTISTHQSNDGEKCWYVGGKIATDSLHLSESEAINLLKNKLKNCFPNMNFAKTKMQCFDINRAEIKAKDFLMPDKPKIQKLFINAGLAFPIKLTLAPLVASDFLKIVVSELNFDKNKTSNNEDLDLFLNQQSGIKVADYPWLS